MSPRPSFGGFGLTNSTVSGNTAGNTAKEVGGGIYNSNGTLTLTNSTVSGNRAPSSGGGIYNVGTLARALLTNSTISGNTSTGGVGGGIFTSTGTADLINTIISGNTAPTSGDCVSDGITSLGHNLDGDGTCGLAATGDLSAADPLLGPLAANGGVTFTHALLVGSPAIDSGDDAAAPATDQRGVSRPQGAASDIGAFEAGSADLAVTKTASPQSAVAGQDLTYTITITNSGQSPATGATLTDTLPGAVTFISASPSQGTPCVEAGGTVTCSLGTIASGDSATVTIVVKAAGLTSLSNTATVSSDVADPDSTNNSATAVTTLAAPPVRVPSMTQWGLVGMAITFAVLILLGLGFKSRLRPRVGKPV